MRRFVRDRINDALDRARPTLEEHIRRHLEYSLGFPYKFAPVAVSIREVRKIKVTATARVDLPPVRIEAILKVWLANRTTRIHGDWDPGVLDAAVN